MRISDRVTPMNSAAGTPLPQTSPTPKRNAPVVERDEIEKVAADVARRRHRGPDVEAGFGGEFAHLRQKRALNDRRARHLVVALAAQDDLVGHAAEGLAEFGKIGDRMAQFVEERGIELVALERSERMGVEADRAVDPADALAHPADDVDEQRGRSVRDFGEGGASEGSAVTGERARAVALRGNWASEPSSPTSEGA